MTGSRYVEYVRLPLALTAYLGQRPINNGSSDTLSKRCAGGFPSGSDNDGRRARTFLNYLRPSGLELNLQGCCHERKRNLRNKAVGFDSCYIVATSRHSCCLLSSFNLVCSFFVHVFLICPCASTLHSCPTCRRPM